MSKASTFNPLHEEKKNITPLSSEGDTITILGSDYCPLAKTWLPDRTIGSGGRTRHYTHREIWIPNIHVFSRLLKNLESKPRLCIIRDKYLGENILRINYPQTPEGYIRRKGNVFEDHALHAIMIEIDDFVPSSDSVNDPISCAEEYILTKLPQGFWLRSYHFQLSSSAGHHSKVGIFKGHLWFWLKIPRTSAQLKAWVRANSIACDASVFNSVQIHFTAAPIFAAGVTDPVPKRSGFVQGLLGDEVDLVIDEALQATIRLPKSPMRTAQIRTPLPSTKTGNAYVRAAIRNAVRAVADAPEGERNATLFKTAVKLFQIIKGDIQVAATVLADAALRAGLEQAEIIATLASALAHRGV